MESIRSELLRIGADLALHDEAHCEVDNGWMGRTVHWTDSRELPRLALQAYFVYAEPDASLTDAVADVDERMYRLRIQQFDPDTGEARMEVPCSVLQDEDDADDGNSEGEDRSAGKNTLDPPETYYENDFARWLLKELAAAHQSHLGGVTGDGADKRP